jgi:hypothetical protein
VGLKTPSGTFLRNINFSALTDAHVRKLFGDVERPAWMKFTIHPSSDPARRQIVFALVVDIDPRPVVDFSPTGARVESWGTRRRFEVVFQIPDPVLAEFYNELPDMFCGWLTKAINEKAHKFYELDPRIGWSVSNGDELAKSPLFDPSGEFSRTGLPERDEDDPAIVTYSRCPFCRETHKDEDKPVWGGANLLWVHPHCWRGS